MEATRGAALSSAPTGNPIVPDPRNEPLARRSQHGGQPGTSALQRLGDWAKRLGTLARRPTRAASRGARGGGEGQGQQHFLRLRVVDACVSVIAVLSTSRSNRAPSALLSRGLAPRKASWSDQPMRRRVAGRRRHFSRFRKGVYALRFRLRWGPRWTVPRLSRGQVGALGPSAPTLPWFGRGQGHAHLRSSRTPGAERGFVG